MPEAYINIDITPKLGGHKFDIRTDLGSQDETISMMLIAIEEMTGVSTDSYVELVDEARKVAEGV
jgi:hypothetical protein